MGFSSYTCAKTNIPFAAGDFANGLDRSLSNVVIVFSDGPSVRGEYDGYGRVRGDGVHDIAAGKLRSQIANGLAKVVLAAFHDPDGDTVETLGKNRPDPGQGLQDPGFLRACHAAGGFASYEGYVLALDGIASPREASGLGRAAAQSVMATQTALREMVSDMRMAALKSEGVSFGGNQRVYPSTLCIRSASDGTGRWAAAAHDARADFLGEPADPSVAEACRGISFAIGDRPPGRREIRAAAERLIQALPIVDQVRVSLNRDGEVVGEAVNRSCPMSDRWYEVRLGDEPVRAFYSPADAGRALGLEDVSELREALWSSKGAATEIELSPSPGPTP